VFRRAGAETRGCRSSPPHAKVLLRLILRRCGPVFVFVFFSLVSGGQPWFSLVSDFQVASLGFAELILWPSAVVSNGGRSNLKLG